MTDLPPNPHPTILLVEDEPAQREALRYNFEVEGFNVDEADNGNEALKLAREKIPDVLVLDWMLPKCSGLEVCRQLKRDPKTRKIPILMLSARVEEVDRVRGLETGADDYVTKPYSIVELIARVKVQIRRSRLSNGNGELQYLGISLNPETHRVSRNGKMVALGPTEYRLLSALLERPGKVWTREKILSRVWGREFYVDTRTIDVHVGRLRKALHIDGLDDPIRTVRGVGYSLG